MLCITTGLYVTVLFHIVAVTAQTGCPLPWVSYDQGCYLFYSQQLLDYPSAVKHCHGYGASLLSINNVPENSYINQQLRVYDSSGYSWYTSGKIDSMTEVAGSVKWQGDGTETREEDQWWLTEADRLLSHTRLVIKTDGIEHGWSKVVSATQLPSICEIPQIEAYRISQDNRDATYGTNLTDVTQADRGPHFVLHPENIVVVDDSRSTTDGEHFSVILECFADSKPMPTYRMLQTSDDGTRVITSATDPRYTLTGGSLSILNPTQSEDAGIYQCEATNQYGTVFSEYANLTFGVLQHFSNVERAPVIAEEYRSAAIECSPPRYTPGISYQWYKETADGVTADFVRPDLNPYMFISSNGKLYFSEATQNDEGDYRCIVKLTANGQRMSSDQPPSRVSLPIPLEITGHVPSTWGPEIADGFIASFPNKPLRGNTVKLECLAYGTLPLAYSWSRKDYTMPSNIQYSDHNRILEIYDSQLEDSGTYYCTVRRNSGNSVQAVHHLIIESKPYFIFPLPDQHADVGSQLTWRCEAKAIPRGIYIWYKNGEHIQTVSGDMEIVTNVMTIMSLDAARHAGVYQCAAINTHGIAFSSAQLRVLAFRPSFAKKPLVSSRSAALGGHVTIECSPEAAPKPEYTWTRNGASLNLGADDGTSRVRLLANGNLHIGQIQSSDAANYCCTATNTLGSDVSCGELKVERNTVLTLTPAPTMGKLNMTSVLMCQASFPGNVDYLYMWRFNGRDIDPARDSHYTIGNSQSEGALYVTSAQYHNSGVYTCVAKTTHDAVNASALLTVEGPPGPAAGVYIDQEGVSNSTATVIWTEGQPHGRPVEFHNIEASTDYNSTWVTVAFTIPITSTIITGSDNRHGYHVQKLKPGNGYYFRVRGINALGIGLASRSSIMIRTWSAPPAKYPDNVGGGGGVVGILTITWDVLPQEDHGATGIGYIVYWRKANITRDFSQEIVNGNVGTFATTVGTDNFYLLYEVKVMAFNDLGVGPISPNGVYIYSAENLPKGVVTNVYAWPYNATAIKVSWQVVPYDRDHMGGILLGYQVNYKVRYDPDASWDAISWRGETHDGVVIGLDPYSWYSVDMQVLNTAGMGPRSEIYHSRTFKIAPRLYPVEIHVHSHSTNSVRITWRGISTDTDEENIEGYVLRYWQTTDDIRSATDIVTERAATEQIVYGIQKDTVYEMRVFGYSRGGDGKHSPSLYFTLGGVVALDPSTSEIMSAASSMYLNMALLSSTITAALWTEYSIIGIGTI